MRLRLSLGVLSICAITLLLGCGNTGDPGGDDPNNSGNPAEVGNSCEKNEDCETDNCYVGPGGGYCTTPCNNEGAVDNCPDDTVCKPIQGGPARCLLICGSDSACEDTNDCKDAYCPDGSSCVDVSDTDHRACEPDPN